MTTITHGTYGYIVSLSILSYLGFVPAIILGIITSLISHLISDKIFYEWGPWRELGNKNEIYKGLGLITLGYILYLLFIIFNFNLLLFIPIMIAGMLPDLYDGICSILKIKTNKGYYFPFHKNTQTFEGTLSYKQTILFELIFVLIMTIGMLSMNWVILLLCFSISWIFIKGVGIKKGEN